MALPRNPRKREFFVYALVAENQPFYIGVGRSERAADRVRYVKRLMAKESAGESVHWVTSSRVLAWVLRRELKVKPKYMKRTLTRAQALRLEKATIEKLRSKGVQLANRQLNGGYKVSLNMVLSNLKQRIGLTTRSTRRADARG